MKPILVFGVGGNKQLTKSARGGERKVLRALKPILVSGVGGNKQITKSARGGERKVLRAASNKRIR